MAGSRIRDRLSSANLRYQLYLMSVLGMNTKYRPNYQQDVPGQAWLSGFWWIKAAAHDGKHSRSLPCAAGFKFCHLPFQPPKISSSTFKAKLLLVSDQPRLPTARPTAKHRLCLRALCQQSSKRLQNALRKLPQPPGPKAFYSNLGPAKIHRDNGKDNGNYHIVYWGSIGIMENTMETTIRQISGQSGHICSDSQVVECFLMF